MIVFQNGVIADNAANAASQVRVSVPDLDYLGRITFGPMSVRAQVTAKGGIILPQRGDRALVAEDTDSGGRSWIVSWTRTDNSVLTPNTITDLDARTIEMDQRPAGSIFLTRCEGAYGAGTVASTFWTATGGGAISNATLSSSAPNWFRWIAAEWARPGKTTKWWIRGQALTNSGTFGTITYSIGVRRIGSVGGAAGGIAYTMVGADTEARQITFVNPTGGASSPSPITVDPPAVDTQYGAYMSNSVTTPASTWIAMHCIIYVYWE